MAKRVLRCAGSRKAVMKCGSGKGCRKRGASAERGLPCHYPEAVSPSIEAPRSSVGEIHIQRLAKVNNGRVEEGPPTHADGPWMQPRLKKVWHCFFMFFRL